MIVAVCPHPPLLAPAFDPQHLPELAPLRAAAREAVQLLLAAGPERITILAGGAEHLDRDEQTGGTLADFGVDVSVGGPQPGLPLAATLGAWLLDDAGWTGPRHYVDPGARESIEQAQALLVMADGTTKRTERAPGHLDVRAEPFDAHVASALAAGDAPGLESLDVAQAQELGMHDAPALVALGAAARASGAEIQARLHLHSAPFGVGYWVATWQVA